MVPRLGELHTVMAALRALGTSIENSGIDDAWIESDVYGSSTVRQILQCSHYKRSLQAHIHTYMAMYEIVLEKFFNDNPHLEALCSKHANDILQAFITKTSRSDGVLIAHQHLCQAFMEKDILPLFASWEAAKSSKSAMFRSLMNYLHRVKTIMFFLWQHHEIVISLFILKQEKH